MRVFLPFGSSSPLLVGSKFGVFGHFDANLGDVASPGRLAPLVLASVADH